ncbi:MAG: 3-deoxy-manno-octulosonate cytidylyltransferase [Bacteroidales bacterium]|nr:3-deoxy-manno-octulosonate cytidylyltransferase [Bacteroidales bacterium]
MKALGVIPARYASTRFPGKPLADINGKSMIQLVYEQANKSRYLDHAIVATDDERIYNHVKGFGGDVMMTDTNHQNGTSRCAQVVENLESSGDFFDVVLNIQGDEPFIQPEQIDQVIRPFENPKVEICSLASQIMDLDALQNPNVVKVVMNQEQFALYFSRSPIPYVRDFKSEEWIKSAKFYKHLGLYAFRSDVLKRIVKLSPSDLERAENLEQLRWLENGIVIHMSITDVESYGIDTPEDLTKFINNSCE